MSRGPVTAIPTTKSLSDSWRVSTTRSASFSAGLTAFEITNTSGSKSSHRSSQLPDVDDIRDGGMWGRGLGRGGGGGGGGGGGAGGGPAPSKIKCLSFTHRKTGRPQNHSHTCLLSRAAA